MDWKTMAAALFRAPRPEHFTDFDHCCECAEHDQTLLNSDVHDISMRELGNPGWDPICFATAEGKKYYLPAMVRLSLDTVAEEFYLAQCLFHLEAEGPGGSLRDSCSERQRAFVARFIRYVIERYPEELEANHCAGDALRVYQLWAETRLPP